MILSEAEWGDGPPDFFRGLVFRSDGFSFSAKLEIASQTALTSTGTGAKIANEVVQKWFIL